MEDGRHTKYFFFFFLLSRTTLETRRGTNEWHREAEHVFLGILNKLVHFSVCCCLERFLYADVFLAVIWYIIKQACAILRHLQIICSSPPLQFMLNIIDKTMSNKKRSNFLYKNTMKMYRFSPVSWEPYFLFFILWIFLGPQSLI